MSAPDHVALIVEDDPQIADILKELVASLGHSWKHASTLAEVKSQAAEGGYCYVLLDMQIPVEAGARPLVGSGETALALLRKRDQRRNEQGRHVLPILVVTGYSKDPDFVSKMYDAEADGFIAKPFGDRIDAILDKIRNALARAGRGEHDACGAATAMAIAEPVAKASPARKASASEPAAPARPGAPRPLPPLASWRDLRVYLCDGETVLLSIGDARSRRSYVDFGLASQANRKAKKAWKLLVAVCEGSGTFKWRQFGDFEVAKRVVADLRIVLRRELRLDDDPFEPYTSAGWRAKFAAFPAAPEDLDLGGEVEALLDEA